MLVYVQGPGTSLLAAGDRDREGMTMSKAVIVLSAHNGKKGETETVNGSKCQVDDGVLQVLDGRGTLKAVYAAGEWLRCRIIDAD
jgi:hypothetical protein